MLMHEALGIDEDYYDWIRSYAWRAQERTGGRVSQDDLMQEAALALLEARRRYDASRGAAFETYSNTRVRGAFVDAVRAQSHQTRRGGTGVAEIVAAEAVVGPVAASICEYLGWTIDQYHKFNALRQGPTMEEPSAPPDDPDLLMALERIPASQRDLIVRVYYYGDRRRDIADRMGVTASRVSQLLGAALDRLRKAYAA